MLSITRHHDRRIVRVEINRPEKRNALNGTLVAELTHALNDLSADESLRVIELSGAGKVFSAGADLDALRTMREASYEQNLDDSRLLAGLFTTMRTIPVPIVARVHGHAIAGGCGLVAASDIVVSGHSPRFGFTEVRIGFVPALVSVLLRGRVPDGIVRELFLTGRLVDASEACRMGLVHHCVKDDELDERLDEVSRSIARNTSRTAVAQTKALMHGDPVLFDSEMEAAAAMNATARGSAECRAGVDAFLNRNDAPWVRAWDADHVDRA